MAPNNTLSWLNPMNLFRSFNPHVLHMDGPRTMVKNSYGLLPTDCDSWLADRIPEVRGDDTPLHPVVEELKDLIESKTESFIGFSQMFSRKLKGSEEVLDYGLALKILSRTIQEGPKYPFPMPIWMLLRHPMSTHASLLLDPAINALFKRVLDVWKTLLESPASCSVLEGNNGWLSPSVLSFLSENYEGLPFHEIFECDPQTQHLGFKSWDEFFTRKLREGVRPVECPNDPNAIGAACESQVYAIVRNVQERDSFWIKSERYSLRDMLNHDDHVRQFIGGTVFQGFLAERDYHRWCSPVTGTIVKIVHVPGMYFAQCSDTSKVPPGIPEWLGSLAFITHLNTRMLIFIESENVKIGLMCFVAVGMQEVSGCEATVKEGDSVVRGQELGMFHYGGSTHCLVFRPECKVNFLEKYRGGKVEGLGALVPVRAALATVQ